MRGPSDFEIVMAAREGETGKWGWITWELDDPDLGYSDNELAHLIKLTEAADQMGQAFEFGEAGRSAPNAPAILDDYFEDPDFPRELGMVYQDDEHDYYMDDQAFFLVPKESHKDLNDRLARTLGVGFEGWFDPNSKDNRTSSSARTAAIQRAAIKDARKKQKRGKRPAMSAFLGTPRAAHARKTKQANRSASSRRGRPPSIMGVRRFNGKSYVRQPVKHSTKAQARRAAQAIRDGTNRMTVGYSNARVVPVKGGYRVYAGPGQKKHPANPPKPGGFGRNMWASSWGWNR